jgi:Spy/CpxP family protein refolding chaperone
MKRKCTVLFVALWLCAGATALAQSAPGGDPVAAALIPPDAVMAHQEALGLSDAQRKTIQSDALAAQQRFTTLQWQLSAATEKLVTTLKASHVDQERALAALDSVLALERQLKHTQLTLMIQLKNDLTAEQQARARTFEASGAK